MSLQEETESLADKRKHRNRKRLDILKRYHENIYKSNIVSVYGECEILRPFVWEKKYEKMSYKAAKRKIRESLERHKVALEELKKQKEEQKQKKRQKRNIRRRQQILRKRRRDEMIRKEYELIQQREHQLILKNTQLRTKIRLLDQRPKPIDLLANYIQVLDNDVNGDTDVNDDNDQFGVLNGPLQYFEKLTSVTDLDDLYTDIEVYEEIENGKHVEFWKNVKILVRHALKVAVRSESELTDHELAVEQRHEIHNVIERKIFKDFIEGKSSAELLKLICEVENDLNRPSNLNYDLETYILRKIRIHLARTKLLELHTQMMQKWQSKKLSTTIKLARVSSPIENESSHDIRQLCIDNSEPTLIPIAQINDAKVITQEEHRNEIIPLSAKITALLARIKGIKLPSLKH